MTAIRLDGLATAKAIKAELAERVIHLKQKGITPGLGTLLVGDDPGSHSYVGGKHRDCAEVGIHSIRIDLPQTASSADVRAAIRDLNSASDVTGYIVQLPLPDQIDQEKIINAIDPRKDVDGFHPENFGKMALEMDTFLPATPFGILTLLERYNIETKGKDCVIIGRSKIVGRPMSILMGRKDFPGNSTVTLTHSYTKDIEEYTKKADIVITALGDPHFLKGDMIKEGAVIVDVGITRVDNDSPKGYYLAGDVDFDSCAAKASWITPVPGGVGPMTRAMLMKNTIIAYKTSVYND